MNYVNGEYHLSVNEEEINLKNYIISDNEFIVTYLDKQYSSNDDLIFKLQNGNNKFNISADDQNIILNFIKNYECKITVLNEQLEEVESFNIKNNTYLTENNFSLNKIYQ